MFAGTLEPNPCRLIQATYERSLSLESMNANTIYGNTEFIPSPNERQQVHLTKEMNLSKSSRGNHRPLRKKQSKFDCRQSN